MKPKSEHKSKTEKEPREKKSREDYDEIYLPGQTGSRLQRRMYVEKIPDRSADKKTKSASKKPASTPKP
ncbi:MAG: hypothetical protein ACJ8M4_00630, partial [Chthoniobacterales bacterium]